MKFGGVAESIAEYNAEIDYDNEHRYAEHERELQTEETPEPSDATEDRWSVSRMNNQLPVPTEP
jgi:hypothetical protein